ncbi:MAG: conjugal transfer protein TraF, partial [Marinobacter sp.]
MNANRLSKLSLAIGLSVATTSALASPQAFMSARSFAMGGTGVAVAHPSAAPLANPAMMAAPQHDWADDFGLMLPSVNARFADEEEVIDQIDDIQDSIDTFDGEFPTLNALNDITNSPALQQASQTLQDQLLALDKDNMRINAGAGISFAIPSKTFSVGVFSSATGTVSARGNLAPDDQKILKALATGDINGLGDLTDKTSLAYELENTITNNGTYEFDSYGEGLASAVLEGGLTFATSFDLDNSSSLSIGVSPKYVQLRTYHY